MHYGPVKDYHNQSTVPNTYLVIPERRGLIHQHRGCSGTDARVDTVETRFSVLEIDTMSERKRTGARKAAEVITRTASGVPFGNIAVPAVGNLTTLAERSFRLL